MSAKDQAYLCIELELDKESAQTLSRLIDEESILPRLWGYYEILYDEDSPSDDRTKVMLYYPPDEFMASANLQILLQAMSCEKFNILENQISKLDYLEAYKKHYTSFVISPNIAIVPSWEMGAAKIPEKEIIVCIDPGLAFGTGNHATTRLCLQHLDQNRPQQKSVIDAGCGSGILSIASLLLGARHVLGFDIDANAVSSSAQNIELNREAFTGSYELVEGGFDHPAFESAQADLLIANLTTNILLQNRDRISAGNYDEMLLSGILSEQKEDIVRAFDSDWKLHKEDASEGWVLLNFIRR